MAVAPTIAFSIITDLLSPDLVKSYVASQQVQLDRDLLPIWGLTARCVFIPNGTPIPPGAWRCLFLDDSDQAGALGYHELTPDNLPLMKIFVRDILADRLSWTVTASHEVIETLGDPMINQTVQAEGVEYARELCDAPEDDRFSYNVSGHHLSAFVTPAWFKSDGVAPFTFPPISQISGPFMLADGGYIGERTLPDGQWSQKLAGMSGPRQHKRPGSRTLRRFKKQFSG